MVCDLQGIFNTDMIPPRIEMTDPAIHYASTRGRRMVFGRTDKGKSEMNAFFGPTSAQKFASTYISLPGTRSGTVTGVEKVPRVY